jgi:CBS domain-containing protein
MKVRDLLKIKSRPVITIKPDETIEDALKKMVENDIGALPVCDEACVLVGIVSERDLLRECLKHSDSLRNIKVREVMTKDVAVGNLDDDLDYAASIMKQKRVRHLPIVVGQKLESIVSIRDIIDIQLGECKAEVRYIGLIKKTRFK